MCNIVFQSAPMITISSWPQQGLGAASGCDTVWTNRAQGDTQRQPPHCTGCGIWQEPGPKLLLLLPRELFLRWVCTNDPLRILRIQNIISITLVSKMHMAGSISSSSETINSWRTLLFCLPDFFWPLKDPAFLRVPWIYIFKTEDRWEVIQYIAQGIFNVQKLYYPDFLKRVQICTINCSEFYILKQLIMGIRESNYFRK